MLMMIAAAAPEQPSTEAAQAVKAGLEHEKPDVRKAAAIASMYTPWPILVPVLRAVADADPDGQARGLALAALSNVE